MKNGSIKSWMLLKRKENPKFCLLSSSNISKYISIFNLEFSAVELYIQYKDCCLYELNFPLVLCIFINKTKVCLKQA